jgi:hypothetical protein
LRLQLEPCTQATWGASYGDREQSISFKRPIPVHVTYQTAFTDDSGELQIRPDIYGYDRDILWLMLGDRGQHGPLERTRAVADGPRNRKHGASAGAIALCASLELA